MKRINLLMLIMIVSISNVVFAQKITKESCVNIVANDKYIQQIIFYSDANYNYFTEFEKGKGKNGRTSLAKFDKDMKFIKRIMLSEIAGNNKDVSYETLRILNGNFVLFFEQKNSKTNDKILLSILNKDLSIIKPLTEVVTMDDIYTKNYRIVTSLDSSCFLFYFKRYADNKIGKLNKKIKLIGVDGQGKLSFTKEVEFPKFKENEVKITQLIYDNKNVFFEIGVGYTEPSSYTTPSGSSRNIGYYSVGNMKKTDEFKYNFYVYKYTIQNNSLEHFIIDKNIEDNYLNSTQMKYRNGILYYAGTYNTEKRMYDYKLFRYAGYFLIKVDANTGKLITSNFEQDDEEHNIGALEYIYIKDDGGVFVTVEDNNTVTFSYSGDLVIYNYNTEGKLIWKKVIEKHHKGGNLYKDYEFLHSCVFVKNNTLYILMNESKNNALLPIGKPMAEIKNFEKNISIIGYTFSDTKEQKSIIYNLEEKECPFYIEQNPYSGSIYLTDRINDNYLNYYTNKIYSVGGVDTKRTISVFNIE